MRGSGCAPWRRRGWGLAAGTLLISVWLPPESPAASPSWQSFLYANDLRGVVAGDGGIYCATSGGALFFDPSGGGSFRQWTRGESDLASDTLTCAILSPFGEVWYGTATQGISIYDPRSGLYTPFTSLLESIPSDEIRNLQVQADWIFVFARGGFSVFRGDSLVWMSLEGIDLDPVPSWDLRAGQVFEDEIWLAARAVPDGGFAGGVTRLDLGERIWRDASAGLPAPRNPRDLEVHGDSLWAATDGSVYVWSGGAWSERSRGLPEEALWMDLYSAAGTLWLAGSAGVLAWDPAASTWEAAGQGSPPTTRLTLDASGRLWAGAGGEALGGGRLDSGQDGLWELRGDRWAQHRLSGPPALGFYRDLAFDSGGRLWFSLAQQQETPLIGWLENGVWSFRSKGSWGLSASWTMKLLPDGGALWLANCCCRDPATLEQCAAEVLRANGRVGRYAEAINVRDMTRDAGGAIWFASSSEADEYAFGLTRLDTSDSTWLNVTTVTPGSELRSNNVRAVAVDGPVVWIGYVDQGASRWDPGRDGILLSADDSWIHYSKSETGFSRALLDDRVTAIAVGSGTVWIGTSAGVNLARGADIVDRLTPGFQRLPSGEVKEIVPTPDGGAWIAVKGSGVTRLWPDPYGDFEYTTFGPPGLVHPGVEAVSLDPDRHAVWLGTERGLSFLEPGSRSADVERPAVYPNPFRPSCGHRVRLLGVEGQADGVVVDMEGRRLARFEGARQDAVVWDGRAGGQVVPPGLYIIRIRSAQGRHSIPVAVLDGDCDP